MKQFIKSFLRKNKFIEALAYILQNNKFLNSSGDGEFDKDVDGMFQYAVSTAKQYKDIYSGNLEYKIVLEIGTGFTRATMLYMIKEYNLKKVYCYDRFNCLHENDKKIIEKFNLTKYLNKLEYISGTNDEISKNIEANSIDYIVSNAVLEHVDDMDLLFTNLNNVLADDGQMYHKVDLRCHNRFKLHGELYFHTFSKKLWNMMGGNIGQPNRKLVCDYLECFNKFNLICEVNKSEEFTSEEMNKAKIYLETNDMFKYIISVVEFRLCKK
jgi:SAM-dependent methyltransferase